MLYYGKKPEGFFKRMGGMEQMERTSIRQLYTRMDEAGRAGAGFPAGAHRADVKSFGFIELNDGPISATCGWWRRRPACELQEAVS